LPKGFAGAQAANGSPLPAQTIGEETLAEVTIPSCGWTTVRSAGPAAAIPNELKAGERFLENEFLRMEFNDKGEITSIFDKESGREIAAGLCNSFKMYKDVPSSWDAWDIDSIYTLTPVELNESAAISLAASGPLVAALRVSRPIHHSTMTQTISLRRNSRRMDFQTTVDWHERHKLLKVAFPVDIRAHEAIHEIQFGHIRRANHKSRPYDMDRFEVCNHRWTALAEENRGFAVLNDCKYGVNVADNSINLTLLKAPLAPDMHADQSLHEFTYAFYAWNGSLGESNVVREGYDLNCPVMTVAGDGGEKSVFSLDAANVVLETVKPAEDGSGDIVLRLYESKRMTTRCALVGALPVRSACETDMLERTAKTEVPCVNDDGGGSLCRLTLDFRPFEIKTVQLRMG
jgi:alpha-mannosidase